MIKAGFSEWSSNAIFYDRCFVIYQCGSAVLTFGAYTFLVSFLCVRLYLTDVFTLTRLPVLSNFIIHSFIQKTVITYFLWVRHCAGGTTMRITTPLGDSEWFILVNVTYELKKNLFLLLLDRIVYKCQQIKLTDSVIQVNYIFIDFSACVIYQLQTQRY